MNAREFFPSVEPGLHGRLEDYLRWLEERAVRLPGLGAFLLAGGYGRGEGGIFFPADGSAPALYNDLEFYLFAPRPPSALLASWVKEGEDRFGIEIEIKVMPPGAFASAEPSMFYYDLLSRHVWVAGERAWLDTLPRKLSEASAIPVVEAGRLLVNRGMSLLRCRRWAAGEAEVAAGFCDRIASKLKLALADAVLCAAGRYHWSCLERGRRLRELEERPPDWETLVAWHGEGVEFKLRPVHGGGRQSEWVERLERLRRAWLSTFLWIESRRLEEVVATASGYAGCAPRLFPDEPVLKNLVRYLRDLRRPVRLPFCGGDHPRSRIWKSLALLLEGSEEAAAGLLGVPALRGIRLEEHCRTVWKQYP